MEYNYIKVKDYDINKFDVSEEGDFFVLSFSKDVHVKVSDLAKNIIEKLNGTKTLDQVREELRTDGVELSEEDMISFIDSHLKSKGLLENTEFNKDTSRLWFHLPLLKGEKLGAILDPLSFFYKKNVAISAIIIVFILQIFVIFSRNYLDLLNMQLIDTNTFIAGGIILISAVFHELGHAAAAHSYGVKVGNLGVGIYLYWPVMYTDLSNAWKIDRKKRIVTDFGGIYFQFLFLFFILIAQIISENNVFKIANLLLVFSFWGNLNPALRTDGYWILTDMFGIVNLNARAFNVLKQFIKGIFRRKIEIDFSFTITKKLRPFFYIFLSIYLIATVSILVFAIYFVINAVMNPSIYASIFSSIFVCLIHGDFHNLIKIINESTRVLVVTFLMFYTVISMSRGLFKKK